MMRLSIISCGINHYICFVYVKCLCISFAQLALEVLSSYFLDSRNFLHILDASFSSIASIGNIFSQIVTKSIFKEQMLLKFCFHQIWKNFGHFYSKIFLLPPHLDYTFDGLILSHRFLRFNQFTSSHSYFFLCFSLLCPRVCWSFLFHCQVCF